MPVLQADLLEKLTETKYLSETNYVSYRAIMRLYPPLRQNYLICQYNLLLYWSNVPYLC